MHPVPGKQISTVYFQLNDHPGAYPTGYKGIYTPKNCHASYLKGTFVSY